MNSEMYPEGNTNSPEFNSEIDDKYSAMARFWTDRLLFEKINRENQDMTKIMVATFNPQVVRNYDAQTIIKFERFSLLLENELRNNGIEIIDSGNKNTSKIFQTLSRQADLNLQFIQVWFGGNFLNCKTWTEENTVMAQTNPKNKPIQIWPLILPDNI